MTTAPTADSARDSALETLTTWGATDDPAVSVLIQVLQHVRGARSPSARTLLSRAVSEIPDALGPELLGQISASLAARTSDTDLDTLVERVVGKIGPVVDSRLSRAAAQAAEWSLHGEMKSGAAVWERIRGVERAQTAAEVLAALRELSDVEKLLRDELHAAADEVRRLGGNVVEVPEDPADLLLTLHRLRTAATKTDVIRKTSELEGAVTALTALAKKAADSLPDAEGGRELDGSAVLRSALEAASAVVHHESVGPEDLDARLALLRSWTEGLNTLMDETGTQESSDRLWTGVVGALKGEILTVTSRAATLAEADRPSALAELARLDEALVASAARGGEALQSTFAECLATLRDVRGALDVAAGRSTSRLRETAGRLETFVGRVAAKLPTARIVTARSHLEQVDSVIAEQDVSAIEQMQQALQRELQTLQHDLALIEKHQRDREEARRDSLRHRIRLLGPVAQGRRAAALEAVSKSLTGASGQEIDALRAQFLSIGRQIECEIRCAAVSLLEQAGRPGRGRTNDEQIPAAIRALRTACDGDDLPAIVSSTRLLSDALRAASAPRRRWTWLGLGVAGLAIAAASAYVFLRGPATTRYEIRLRPAVAPVKLAFVEDGKVVQREEAVHEGAAVELAPGTYEVFVNERYTGKVLRVPQDESPLDLPVPNP